MTFNSITPVRIGSDVEDRLNDFVGRLSIAQQSVDYDLLFGDIYWAIAIELSMSVYGDAEACLLKFDEYSSSTRVSHANIGTASSMSDKLDAVCVVTLDWTMVEGASKVLSGRLSSEWFSQMIAIQSIFSLELGEYVKGIHV